MTEPTSVYLYYDRLGVLLYVGITKRGITRQDEHAVKEWWPFVAKQEIEHYDSREVAAARETMLIKERRPPFNRAQNPDHARLKAAYLILFHPEAIEDTAGADDWKRCGHCTGCLRHRDDPEGEWGCRYWPDSDDPAVCTACGNDRCPYPSGYDAGLIDGYMWETLHTAKEFT